MKHIEVVIEPKYGKWVYYPSCEAAKTFAQIAGTKTLTEDTLALIKKLGYDIKASAKSINELIGSVSK